jgi:hypothetical protein
VDSEKKRSDEYWMGVRDALRMVDSFNKWAQRNKERAKDLDDFIHDGLIAAAKRCESCLKDDLGLTFIEGEDHPLAESVPPGYEAALPDETTPPEQSDEVTLQSSEDDITIESVGRSDAEEMEDISLEGPTREFSSDFDLIEPAPLVVEPSPPEPELVSSEEAEEKKPSFTWADYEEAVTMTKTDPVVEEPEEEEPSFGSEPVGEEDLPIDEPVSLGSPKVLTPSEEPSIPTAEFESTIGEGIAPPVDEETEDSEIPEPITEPPAPPPPPESEEDEDERRRRARRLFFGD